MADVKRYEVTKGKIEKPMLLLVYGPDKVGKSSFAASAPLPVFLDLENGSGDLDVARLPKPANFREAVDMVNTIAEDKDFQTLVVDTLDWLEPLVYEQVCAEAQGMPKSIAEIPFGKGYPLAVMKWREFIEALEKVRASGKHVILLAHSVVKRFEDPTTPAGYDRYQLKLHDGSATSKTESTADLFKQYVECILFANLEVYPNADDPRRAYGDGTRVMFTERRPSHDAGNRFGLPYKLPLSWEAFHAEANPKKGEAEQKLKNQIQEMLGKLKDPEVKKKAEEAFPKKKSLTELNAFKTKLEAHLA